MDDGLRQTAAATEAYRRRRPVDHIDIDITSQPSLNTVDREEDAE